jgi:hypothetical protein
MRIGLKIGLSFTGWNYGSSAIPANAILFNGVPLLYNGEFLTYN